MHYLINFGDLNVIAKETIFSIVKGEDLNLRVILALCVELI